jgi:predicted permease
VYELIPIVAPVFVCAAIGWAWVRLGQPYDAPMISRVISDIGAPCLVFSRLTTAEIEPAFLVEMAGLGLLVMGVAALIGAVVLRASRLPLHTFLAPLTFGNVGNMGLPLCLFAFGEDGLALGICIFATSAFLQFTAGVWVWTSRVSVAELLRTPLTYAAVLAVSARFAEFPIPLWLANTTWILGGFAIPLMLLTLGVSLGELQLAGLRRTLGLALLRLLMGFAIGLSVSELFALEGIARGVLIVQSSMPPAVFNYLMALRYGRSPEQVASLLIASTLLAFLLLPLLMAFVL